MVDGRWTTRTLDIHQILARNRQEKQEIQQIPSGVKPPIKGILTSTVVRSPVVKSIIPARIRHRSKNDVIFVYDDYIVIKEIVGGERIEDNPFSDISLNDVAAKKDFDSSIQAARILGQPRRPKSSRFPGKYWSSPNSPQYPPEIKQEPMDEIEVPPQILVLSTSSRILIFLFAYLDVYEEARFISTTWPLPAQVSVTEELGVHLAVDPKYLPIAYSDANFLTLPGLVPWQSEHARIESSSTLSRLWSKSGMRCRALLDWMGLASCQFERQVASIIDPTCTN
ncbi:MAG: hypothetical protein Q9183_002502 [Haloplaca sp. 2 TL-2023]